MITCLVVVTIDILHIITAPWVKENLAGSPKPNTAELPEPEPEPTPSKIGKLRLSTQHRLLLDIHMYRHRANQSVFIAEEAMLHASAIEAESAEIERHLAKEQQLITAEIGGLEAEMNKEKAALVTKINATQAYINENLALQYSQLRAQLREIENEHSRQVYEYDGLKQSIENSNFLEDGYLKQIAGMEKMFKARSAYQVTEKGAVTKAHKKLTAEISSLEKQITTTTTFRLQAVKLEELNIINEERELKRAANNYIANGVPRLQLIEAWWIYCGAFLACFIATALMLFFNITIIGAVFRSDLVNQLLDNFI